MSKGVDESKIWHPPIYDEWVAFTETDFNKIAKEVGWEQYDNLIQYLGNGLYRIGDSKFSFMCSAEGVKEFDKAMKEKVQYYCDKK